MDKWTFSIPTPGNPTTTFHSLSPHRYCKVACSIYSLGRSSPFPYKSIPTCFILRHLNVVSTVDGQKVPDVHRGLICQKVSVSRNLSQNVIPSDEDFSCVFLTFTSEVITLEYLMNVMHGIIVMVYHMGQNQLALCMELRNGVPQNTITLIVKFALWCT